tara:strand:+ start:54 stop:182 length:129 start_codon:yes stop_codon:yes gene_type:complete
MNKWIVGIDPNDDGYELRGDYFKTFDQAVDHYRERCRQHRCK